MKWPWMKACKERPEVDTTRGDTFAAKLDEVRRLAKDSLALGAVVAQELADHKKGPQRDHGG